MDFTALEQLGVDKREVLERFMQNKDLYARILIKFRDDPTYKEFKEAEKNRDYEKMFRAAHTLKGVAGNLGLSHLCRSVSDIADQLRHGEPQNPDLLLEDIYSLDQKYELAKQVLDNL